MNFRHFGNEKGITLIELMAALSLFAIVIALASTVIFQLMKGNETSGEKISLSQDTNVLVQELRRQYYDGNTKLCLNENDRGLIKDYKILSGNERALQFHNGCIEAVDPDEPLHMELTTMNKSGNELAVSTTLSKQKAHEMKVAIERDNEDDEELPDDKDFSEFALMCIRKPCSVLFYIAIKKW